MSTKLAKLAADFRTTLATEIAVGGTTGSLQSALDDDGVVLPTGTYFFTLDTENTSKEHIVCTCTAGTLTSIKSVSRQGAQTSGVARKHRIGASVVITDFAHILYLNELLSGVTDLDHLTPLKYDGTATISDANALATKDYVDGVAVAGAPNASATVKGIVELATGAELAAGTGTGGTGAAVVAAGSSFKNASAGAADANKVPVLNGAGVLDQTFLDAARTWGAVQSFSADNCQITSDPDSENDAVRQSYLKAEIAKGYTTGTAGETLAIGNAVYLKASDSKLYKAVGSANEATFSFVGIAVSAGNANDTIYYARPGDVATGLSGLTAGSFYYVSDSAGVLSTTPGTRLAKVGQALSTTTMRVCEPKFVARGKIPISGTGDTVVTTGFYPALVQIHASPASYSSVSTRMSLGDDGNRCIYHGETAGTSTGGDSDTEAFTLYLASNTPNTGTVSAKSATGFTVNTDSYTGAFDLYWTAFSE